MSPCATLAAIVFFVLVFWVIIFVGILLPIFRQVRANSNTADVRLHSAAPELLKELRQSRVDIEVLIANIRAHEELTGQSLEGEDAAVVQQIEMQYDLPSPAIRRAEGK